MPKLTIEGQGSFDVTAGKRLVLAIEEAGVDILHRCGGWARCTTCKVEFAEGEPDRMTKAEAEKLESQGNLGKFRLSCQCTVDGDMTVRPLMRLSETDMDDAGSQPADEIEPRAEWVRVGSG